MTNYERVKQMSLDEMVDFINHETDGICDCCHPDIRFRTDECYKKGLCAKGIKMWLESEESGKEERSLED